MLKVIRAALLITIFTAFAAFVFAQHDHAAKPDTKADAKATCSCCADSKDGKMAACCDVEKCKMDAKGNCTTNECCKKSGANACKKACAKATSAQADHSEHADHDHSASSEHADHDHAGMSCARKGKGGCCGGKAASEDGAK